MAQAADGALAGEITPDIVDARQNVVALADSNSLRSKAASASPLWISSAGWR